MNLDDCPKVCLNDRIANYLSQYDVRLRLISRVRQTFINCDTSRCRSRESSFCRSGVHFQSLLSAVDKSLKGFKFNSASCRACRSRLYLALSRRMLNVFCDFIVKVFGRINQFMPPTMSITFTFYDKKDLSH
jgi:hypothetical protein